MTQQTIFWEDISPLLLSTSSRTGHQCPICCLVTSLLCLQALTSCWWHLSFLPDFCLKWSPHIFLSPPLAVKMYIFSVHPAGLNKISGEKPLFWCGEEEPWIGSRLKCSHPCPATSWLSACPNHLPPLDPLLQKQRDWSAAGFLILLKPLAFGTDCSLLWGGPAHCRIPGLYPSDVRNIRKLWQPNTILDITKCPLGVKSPLFEDWPEIFTLIPVLKAFDIN